MGLGNEQAVIDLISEDEWMMDLLRAARTLDLPDWWICAGFVRSKLWDTLHQFDQRTPLSDIDVIYFDPKNKYEEKEKQLEHTLYSIMSNIPWSVKNEARMHLRNNLAPYLSATDAIGKFPETATALGICLDEKDKIHLAAPHGVEDVLDMVVHPTPFFIKSKTLMAVYHERIKAKNWSEHWYLVRYADENEYN